MSLNAQKVALRRLLKAQRAQLSDFERTQKSKVLCKQLRAAVSELLKERKAHQRHTKPFVVAIFQPLEFEPQLSSFIEYLFSQGCVVSFPSIELAHMAQERVMHMRAVSPTDWQNLTAPFLRSQTDTLVLSPTERERYPLTAPQELNLLICPLLGFDLSGRRLGYGGGFYDRYLPLVSRETTIWGVAFAEQMMPEIPCEDHDLPLPRIFYA